MPWLLKNLRNDLLSWQLESGSPVSSKSRTQQCVCLQSQLWRLGRRFPVAHWPGSLLKPVHSQVTERLCPKNKVEKWLRDDKPLVSTCKNIHTYKHTYTYRHTQQSKVNPVIQGCCVFFCLCISIDICAHVQIFNKLLKVMTVPFHSIMKVGGWLGGDASASANGDTPVLHCCLHCYV